MSDLGLCAGQRNVAIDVIECDVQPPLFRGCNQHRGAALRDRPGIHLALVGCDVSLDTAHDVAELGLRQAETGTDGFQVCHPPVLSPPVLNCNIGGVLMCNYLR